MPEILSFVLVMAVMTCGFSIIVSPLLGKKMDPFLILRPLFRAFQRLLSHTVRALKNRARATWRRAQQRSRPSWLRLTLYSVSAILGIGAVILAIPAEIIGTDKKK